MLMALPFFLLFAQPVVRAEPVGGFGWPLKGSILRGFEKPKAAYGEGGHQGIDIAGPSGAIVRAAGDGTVEWVGELPRGRFISISHSGGIRTTYLDLERINVRRGARVRRGQAIATLAGGRDDSSAQNHLHFDAYMHGSPVDPRLLLGGSGEDSFIRLCPVERGGGARPGGVVGPGQGPEPWRGPTRGLPGTNVEPARPPGGFWHLLKSGLAAAWNATCAFGRWVGRTTAHVWSSYLYKGLAYVGRGIANGFQWMWSNRWVQAVTAGIIAAVAVIGLIVLAVIAFSISLVVAVVAAIAAVVVCIGVAIYYAATHKADFSFASCFARSFTAGAIAAGLVISAGQLAGTFSAGWAELGLWGTTKAAVWNGVFSAMFEGGTSFVFNGRISLKRILVAFAIGAVSGGLGKLVKTGLASSKILEVFSFSASGTRAGIIQLSQSAFIVLKEGTATLQGFLLAVRDAAISLGSKLAYLGFSGTLGAALNTVACAVTGRPITFSGCFAAFLTGVAMGAVSLSFGAKGIDGLLLKFKVFEHGIGRFLRGFVARIMGKTLHKGIDQGLKKGFKWLFGEEEA